MHGPGIGVCRLTVIAWLALAGTAAVAGGAKDKPTAAPFRLDLPDAAAYRLPASGDFRLAPPYQVRASSPALAAKPYARQVDEAARRQGLDPALVHAVIEVESGYNAKALSPKGARGLMQVLPETASRYGGQHRLYAVDDNLQVGTRYLKSLMDMFDQRLDLALAAYNAGEGAVVRHGNRIPPYAETREYVPAVLGRYEAWRSASPLAKEYVPGTRLNLGWRELLNGGQTVQDSTPGPD